MSEVVAPPAATSEAPPAAGPPAGVPAAPDGTPPTDQQDGFAGLPERTQQEIRSLRSEAATLRERAKVAEETSQKRFDAIAKELGLKGDDDPAKAAQKAVEERDAARKAAQDAGTTLSVYRMAAKQGANPEALTDSRAFMAQLDALDPAADDFVSQMEAVVKAAVEANPLLKGVAATPVPPARSGVPVNGGAAVAGQVTEEELTTMSPAQIESAQAEGRLTMIFSKKAGE